MLHPDTTAIIAQTKKWIADVVVGCNFCPFASGVLKQGTIKYEVLINASLETTLQAVVAAMQQLNNEPNIETTLLILPNSFLNFEAYLDLLEDAETLLQNEGYEGMYQVASFHPAYLFAGSTEDDPSNYTNRSPYPMLHFLREASVSKAVDGYAGIDKVPGQNIKFAHEKGLLYMKQLLAACSK